MAVAMQRGLLALALLTGCSSPTRILVVVDSDFAVPGRLRSLSLSAWRTGGDPTPEKIVELTGRTEEDPGGDPHAQLPLSFAVVSHGSPDIGVEITVRGLDDVGGAFVERRAIVDRFVAGRTLVLPIFLGQACEASLSCPAGETCDDGVCRDAHVEAGSLRFATAPGDELMRDGGTECDAARFRWVAAGPTAGHTCALTECGGLVCWGANEVDQIAPGSTPLPVTEVPWPGPSAPEQFAAGAFYSCAAASDGVYCWGNNDELQLGEDSFSAQPFPRLVAGVTGPIGEIVAGDYHTCAISGGSVWCWGDNTTGQLGSAPGDPVATPTPVSGVSDVAHVCAGSGFTCAATSAGSVFCWGDDSYHQLGDGVNQIESVPVPIGIDDAVAIACGRDHACAIRGATERRVSCWGSNFSGQLGDDTVAEHPMPFDTGVVGIAALAAGITHTCALTTGGTVICWGNAGYGQLGPGAPSGGVIGPTDVTGLTGVTHLAAGDFHNCARDSSARVYCWGRNIARELGDLRLLTDYRAEPGPISWP